MTNSRRVVVTGIGLVSSLGIGTDANWAALSAGRSGVETITKFDASQFAMDDAGVAITKENAGRVGVFIASGIGGFTTIEREHKALLEGGPRKISPFFIPSAIINLAAGQVSIRFGAKGPNSATCTACSASAHAIGDAYEI